MNNDTLTTNLDSEEIIAGVVMITMGTLCFIISVIVIAQITRESAFHNAFGYLCLSNLAANSAELLINVLWTGPATLLQFDESVTHSFIGGILAQLILLFWFAIIYGHLEIAINRIVAIAWPVRYSKIFAGRNVIYFITCSWILSFIHSLWYSWCKLSNFYY
ncbi:hypothetical protein ANCCAN_12123 [Ancylostoma caninum]|uniref:G-protein coupled receptors family 1 profile domain-containing protein n=1 Tax=Ancylostoma caninum TaxID=29170 RepID=A0A368GF77_ANCCA|nr:hypothetical protein ANCCAN_12123 [Ancylostoma caninum]